MHPSFFNGTNQNYAFWIDMNEPAVFNVDTMTMSLDSLHYTTTGQAVQHRDVHNMYGTLQHKATYTGMLKRDNYERRPFVLTRAFFFGS
jgi:alpha-glucosidase (family GH31 glycosyl hydrolase)